MLGVKVGVTEGLTVGFAVGSLLGDLVGTTVGVLVGAFVGGHLYVGPIVVGGIVGTLEILFDGAKVGVAEGSTVGERVAIGSHAWNACRRLFFLSFGSAFHLQVFVYVLMAFLQFRFNGQDLWPSNSAANASLQGASRLPNASSETTVHLVALIKFSW
jgi:hypothetical protein